MTFEEAIEKHMKKLHAPDPPQDKEKNLILSLQAMNRTLHKRIEELERALRELVDSAEYCSDNIMALDCGTNRDAIKQARAVLGRGK